MQIIRSNISGKRRPIRWTQITRIPKGVVFVQDVFGHVGRVQFGHVFHIPRNGTLDRCESSSLVWIRRHGESSTGAQHQNAFPLLHFVGEGNLGNERPYSIGVVVVVENIGAPQGTRGFLQGRSHQLSNLVVMVIVRTSLVGGESLVLSRLFLLIMIGNQRGRLRAAVPL